MPAKGQTGNKHSAETRKKISDAVKRAYKEKRLTPWSKGLTKDDDPRIKGFQGKHTKETKAKISANRKGKCLGNQNAAGTEAWNKGKKHNVHDAEWRKKVSEANSGPNHWNWKGGISTENRKLRNSSKHKEWAAAVMKRDKWICQHCGYKGRDIVAHHIKPWSAHKSLRFTVSNGLTLCRSCHCKVHKPRTGTGKSQPLKRQKSNAS